MPTKPTSKAGMSSRDKGLIVFVVLAVLFAGGFIYHTWSQQQGHATAHVTIRMEDMPKGAWMKAQKSGQDTSAVPVTGGGQPIPGPNGNSSGSGQ